MWKLNFVALLIVGVGHHRNFCQILIEGNVRAERKGRTLRTISSSNRLDKAASLALDASDIDDRIDDLILSCVSTAVFSSNDK